MYWEKGFKLSKFGFLVYIIKLFLHQVNVFLHVVSEKKVHQTLSKRFSLRITMTRFVPTPHESWTGFIFTETRAIIYVRNLARKGMDLHLGWTQSGENVLQWTIRIHDDVDTTAGKNNIYLWTRWGRSYRYILRTRSGRELGPCPLMRGRITKLWNASISTGHVKENWRRRVTVSA